MINKKLFINSLFIVIILLSMHQNSFAQISAATDSVIRSIMGEGSVPELNDKGTEMMLSGNVSGAGSFYNEAIKKDEGNKEAYYNRGIVHWVMNDTNAACRDWSAVLALGDTATFKLLDSKCHGAMMIDNDVLPKAKYHELFSNKSKEAKSNVANGGVITVAEVMPQFPGGETALMDYLSNSVKIPAAAKSKNIHGRVYINFIISSKGKILFPYVVRGIGSGCDQEALRVVKSMPSWKPGMQKGKPVLVRYNLPVR